MTDRELLEMAAKAAGIHESLTWTPGATPWLKVSEELSRTWNPLADDGDALRLAVKLKLLVDFDSCCAMGPKGTGGDDWFGGGKDEHACISHDDCDAEAATRRAIVRAAAEIGRAMQ